MVKLAIIAIAYAAAVGCGDNIKLGDGGAGSGDTGIAAACTAMFAGNFTETATSADNCATLATFDAITFALPSNTLSAPLAVEIDFGASAATGSYSSETVPMWSASGMRADLGSNCLYVGGSAITPQGSFMLAIVSVDAATAAPHGTLDLELTVLEQLGTDCGAELDETVTVAF